MKRSEQDIRFQWDLTKIYPDTAAWEAAMQEAEAALAPLAARAIICKKAWFGFSFLLIYTCQSQ